MKLAVPALAFVMLASVAASAWAAPYAERKPLVAVTKHTGEFDGKAVAYTATVQENFMAGRRRQAERRAGDHRLCPRRRGGQVQAAGGLRL
jgi:hypothetical protein